MNQYAILAAAGLAALAVGACVEDTQNTHRATGMRQASSAAESACMSAVKSQYGGKVATVNVLSSEFSQANSDVMLAAVGVRGGHSTEKWRCLVSNDGKVQELTAAGK